MKHCQSHAKGLLLALLFALGAVVAGCTEGNGTASPVVPGSSSGSQAANPSGTLTGRPDPTVALMPVTIAADSINADRSELTLHFTVVASAAAPFVLAGYGDHPTTPSLGLALGDRSQLDTVQQCSLWLDRVHTVPACFWPSNDSTYSVSVQQFEYLPGGVPPPLAVAGPVSSSVLLLDQSSRVADLDPQARRSFAVRQVITRSTFGTDEPLSLSVAGFAGNSGNPSTVATLPELPVWTPLGSSAPFSSDRATLDAATSALEPLVGGSAPVLDALQQAMVLSAGHAPPGSGSVIALLGGADSSGMPAAQSRVALAQLRQQRDAANLQAVIIAAAPDQLDRASLAEISTTLRAPTIFLGPWASSAGGMGVSWGTGVFAALDLAADLVHDRSLPTLTAEFRVTASQVGAFVSGSTLRGALYIESSICPMGCWEFPLEFVAEIP